VSDVQKSGVHHGHTSARSGVVQEFCESCGRALSRKAEDAPQEILLGQVLGEHAVEFFMRADPEPSHGISFTIANSTQIQGHTHRPNISMAFEFFESQ